MIALHETGLVDRVRCVRTWVPSTDPSLQIFKDNPLGLLPTLVPEDAEPVFGSAVIMHYLDSLHDGPRLVPTETATQIWALRMQEAADTLVSGLMMWAFLQNQPPEIFQARIGQIPLRVERTLQFLEFRADELASIPVNVGHISVATMLSYADFRLAAVLDWWTAQPRLAEWYGQFAARPSFINTQFVDEANALTLEPRRP
jgi:glutathione S-transferase